MTFKTKTRLYFFFLYVTSIKEVKKNSLSLQVICFHVDCVTNHLPSCFSPVPYILLLSSSRSAINTQVFFASFPLIFFYLFLQFIHPYGINQLTSQRPAFSLKIILCSQGHCCQLHRKSGLGDASN